MARRLHGAKEWAPPQRIGTKHANDSKYQYYKQYYQEHHHPTGHVHHTDYCWNGFFWVFMLLIFGLFAAVLIVGIVHPRTYHPPLIVARSDVNRSRDMHAVKRTACTTGEVYDSDVGMCGPTFHAPLAFDGSIMDHHTAACDSFYRNMCGTWNDEHTNDNRAFSYAYHKNQKHLAKLISFETMYRNGVLVPAPSSSSVTDFYRSCLRASSPHQRKESVLEHKHMLKRILGGVSRMGDVPVMFGKLARAGFTLPFQLSIERHPTEPRMIPLLAYDGFPHTLTESQIISLYQRTTDVHGLNILEMDHHIQSVLGIMRATRMHSVQPLESITDYVSYVKHEFAADVMRFDALPQMWNVRGHHRMPGWHVLLQELDGTGMRFDTHQEMWVVDHAYFEWLFNEGIAHFTFKEWYAYAEFSILYHSHDFVPSLPDDVYFQQHDERGPIGPGGQFYNRLPRDLSMNHTTTTHAEERCVRITQHLLPGLVARRFLHEYMPEKERIKKEVQRMVHSIITSFVHMVRETPWLSEQDQNTLVDKMHATLVRVVEPNQWHVEPFAERISGDLYWHNLNMIRAYRVQRNLELWSRDNLTHFDRSALAFFAMPLTTVNAYYSGPSNTITVLAGILQAPFYNERYNDISKYAILGSILGHELSHMADNHGLYWNRMGSLAPHGILSESGMQEFYKRTECVVREYGPAPLGCEDANAHYGNSTLGEDLADLIGIELAWRAYLHKYPNAPLADRQHFFMILAQAFCEKYDQQHLCEAVKNDVHAIAMFRINRTFRNLEQFQRAFGCHAGQHMHTQDRCRVYGS